jgi:peptide deformylase
MGKEIEIESDDFLAIVLQHEIDHLKGKLFIDYLSPLKQKVALKKVKNACRN